MGIAAYSDFAMALTRATNQPTPAEKLQALQDLQRNHGLPLGGAETQGCLDYLHALVRLTEASGRQADPVKGKYGKMIYRYVHGVGICIFAKYPNPVMVHPEAPLPSQTVLMRKLRKG
jgi:hypothetical protein